MIVNFFIEVDDRQHWINLERSINRAGYAFYDATEHCTFRDLTVPCELEDIEAHFENK
jgi:hypothetical protein